MLSDADFPALPAAAAPRRDQLHPFIPPRSLDLKPTPTRKSSASAIAATTASTTIVTVPAPVIVTATTAAKRSPAVVPIILPPSKKSAPSPAPSVKAAVRPVAKAETSSPATTTISVPPTPASAAAPVFTPAPAPPLTPKASRRPSPPSVAPAVTQAPLLSKKAKKAKTTIKIPKPPKDDNRNETKSTVDPSVPSSPASSTAKPPPVAEITCSNTQDDVSDISPVEPVSLSDLLAQISRDVDLDSLAFFNPQSVNPKAPMPLRYGPLVHALSALSVGGGSFANSLPSGSIDSAVSSFQQLLETLTQTISDLLRLLPRTTWDDSSSFDGVLRDMLKAEEFLEDGDDDATTTASNKDDEVAALTIALEKRARWMEVQLAKLEELHRDINTAAVRAVLSFNDRGWDAAGFLPKTGGSTLR